MSLNEASRWRQRGGHLYLPEERDLIQRTIAERSRALGIVSLVEFPEGKPERSKVLDVGSNLIVDTGRASLASLQRDTAVTGGFVGSLDLGKLALGRGSTAPQPDDIGLDTESTGAGESGTLRPTLAVSTPPPGPPFTTNLWTGQIGSADMNTAPFNSITEIGIFCLDDTTLFGRRVFAAQTKSAGFVLEVRYSVLM